MGPQLPRLFGFELIWADAVFGAIFPESPRTALVHGIASMKPARFLDELIATVPIEPSIGLRIALWIVAFAPLFTIRKLTTFAALDADDRERVLGRLLASPIYAVRQLVLGLKAMASLLYAQSPAIRRQMSTAVATALPGTSLVRVRTKQPAGKRSTNEHVAA